MNKVLYFGSFNPVHFGHTGIARYVASMPETDAVVIIPSPHNPFKDTSTLANPQLRLEQVRRAFDGISPKITVSDIEYHLPEPLYTIRTLRCIQQSEPGTDLILLIGADNAASIQRWYKGPEILAGYEVWVYPRTGYDGESLCRNIASGGHIRGIRYLSDAPILDISSTRLRDLSSRISVRQATKDDIPQMCRLFRDTVLSINIRDYTEDEVEDWASCGTPERFTELLGKHRFIVAADNDGTLSGFCSMNSEGYLHSLFVHKDRQGQGIGSLLLSEAEIIAREYDVKEITSDVSLTARAFFEHHGYEVLRKQTSRARHLEMTNFHMRKILSF